MCLGLGASDNSGAMDRAEKERQAQIANTTAKIRGLFADPSREKAYGEYQQDVLDYNLDRHGRDATDSQRALRFALARKGLAGGSANIDAQGRLDRNISEQATQIGEHAETAANQLRAADQRAKGSLIGQAQAGLDATTATQRALEDMQTNLALASEQTRYQGLGGLMSDIALAQAAEDERLGRSRATLPPAYQALRPDAKAYAGTTTRIGS